MSDLETGTDESADATDTDDIDDIDLDAIEADLNDVQTALARLADGTYWVDEVTGEPLPTELLEAQPLLRRA